MSEETPKKVVANYPSNSQKSKKAAEPKEAPKKVVSNEVTQRRKPLGRKLADTFAGDDARSVGGYILFEVVIPTLKSLISDAVSQGVERMLFGEASTRSSKNRRHTSYNQMYKGRSDGYRHDDTRPGGRPMSQRSRANHDFDEILIEDRGEAEEVLEQLIELIDRFDLATVADLYSLTGVSGSFQDDKWGWYELGTAQIKRVRGGWLLDLPRPQPID